jgi:hypothetical protein
LFSCSLPAIPIIGTRQRNPIRITKMVLLI